MAVLIPFVSTILLFSLVSADERGPLDGVTLEKRNFDFLGGGGPQAQYLPQFVYGNSPVPASGSGKPAATIVQQVPCAKEHSVPPHQGFPIGFQRFAQAQFPRPYPFPGQVVDITINVPQQEPCVNKPTKQPTIPHKKVAHPKPDGKKKQHHVQKQHKNHQSSQQINKSQKQHKNHQSSQQINKSAQQKYQAKGGAAQNNNHGHQQKQPSPKYQPKQDDKHAGGQGKVDQYKKPPAPKANPDLYKKPNPPPTTKPQQGDIVKVEKQNQYESQKSSQENEENKEHHYSNEKKDSGDGKQFEAEKYSDAAQGKSQKNEEYNKSSSGEKKLLKTRSADGEYYRKDVQPQIGQGGQVDVERNKQYESKKSSEENEEYSQRYFSNESKDGGDGKQYESEKFYNTAQGKFEEDEEFNKFSKGERKRLSYRSFDGDFDKDGVKSQYNMGGAMGGIANKMMSGNFEESFENMSDDKKVKSEKKQERGSFNVGQNARFEKLDGNSIFGYAGDQSNMFKNGLFEKKSSIKSDISHSERQTGHFGAQGKMDENEGGSPTGQEGYKQSLNFENKMSATKNLEQSNSLKKVFGKSDFNSEFGKEGFMGEEFASIEQSHSKKSKEKKENKSKGSFKTDGDVNFPDAFLRKKNLVGFPGGKMNGGMRGSGSYPEMNLEKDFSGTKELGSHTAGPKIIGNLENMYPNVQFGKDISEKKQSVGLPGYHKMNGEFSGERRYPGMNFGKDLSGKQNLKGIHSVGQKWNGKFSGSGGYPNTNFKDLFEKQNLEGIPGRHKVDDETHGNGGFDKYEYGRHQDEEGQFNDGGKWRGNYKSHSKEGYSESHHRGKPDEIQNSKWNVGSFKTPGLDVFGSGSGDKKVGGGFSGGTVNHEVHY